MYKRDLSALLTRFATFYPVICITGPRQSGKTTVAKLLFPHLPYVSLENFDIRFEAERDPRAFLANYPDGAIFDEVQNLPMILSYLQEIVDTDSRKGRFIITGSQNFALSSNITQSLAGRVGMVTLLPMSMNELRFDQNIDSYLFQGGYPALHKLGMYPRDFYPSYIQTYLERDVRQIRNIENLGNFQKFLKLCAGRVGQLINLSSMAQDAGISHTTARSWLTILEASYIIFTLQPHYQNFNKRLVKMPKLYFYDTGLACNLLGLEKEEQIETHYLKGALFENLVILEIMKARLNDGLPHNLYFWRDRTGHEIDLLAEWGGELRAIEIKSATTFQHEYVKNLHYFNEIGKNNPIKISSYLVYNGKQEGSYLNVKLVPMGKICINLLRA
jgi:predicted AAA+ superfamily ATPase